MYSGDIQQAWPCKAKPHLPLLSTFGQRQPLRSGQRVLEGVGRRRHHADIVMILPQADLFPGETRWQHSVGTYEEHLRDNIQHVVQDNI